MNSLTFIPFSNPYLSCCLYCANLTATISLRSSTKLRSKERSSSLLPPRSWLDLKVGKPVFVEITASDLYVMEKGVLPMDLLGVVRYVHKIWESSSTHFPFVSSSLFFNPSTITLFVASACPLLWGYDGVEYLFFIPKSQQYLQKALLSN